MNPLRPILLAEDSARDVELTLSSLAEAKIANPVVTVRDGVEALDWLRRAPQAPAVVLLDIKMPRLDGIETLREIRRDPALKLTPIVMLTSSREERDIVTSYQLGVNGYVMKPVDFAQFADSIQTLGLFWAIINERAP